MSVKPIESKIKLLNDKLNQASSTTNSNASAPANWSQNISQIVKQNHSSKFQISNIQQAEGSSSSNNRLVKKLLNIHQPGGGGGSSEKSKKYLTNQNIINICKKEQLKRGALDDCSNNIVSKNTSNAYPSTQQVIQSIMNQSRSSSSNGFNTLKQQDTNSTTNLATIAALPGSQTMKGLKFNLTLNKNHQQNQMSQEFQTAYVPYDFYPLQTEINNAFEPVKNLNNEDFQSVIVKEVAKPARGKSAQGLRTNKKFKLVKTNDHIKDHSDDEYLPKDTISRELKAQVKNINENKTERLTDNLQTIEDRQRVFEDDISKKVNELQKYAKSLHLQLKKVLTSSGKRSEEWETLKEQVIRVRDSVNVNIPDEKYINDLIMRQIGRLDSQFSMNIDGLEGKLTREIDHRCQIMQKLIMNEVHNVIGLTRNELKQEWLKESRETKEEITNSNRQIHNEQKVIHQRFQQELKDLFENWQLQERQAQLRIQNEFSTKIQGFQQQLSTKEQNDVDRYKGINLLIEEEIKQLNRIFTTKLTQHQDQLVTKYEMNQQMNDIQQKLQNCVSNTDIKSLQSQLVSQGEDIKKVKDGLQKIENRQLEDKDKVDYIQNLMKIDKEQIQSQQNVIYTEIYRINNEINETIKEQDKLFTQDIENLKNLIENKQDNNMDIDQIIHEVTVTISQDQSQIKSNIEELNKFISDLTQKNQLIKTQGENILQEFSNIRKQVSESTDSQLTSFRDQYFNQQQSHISDIQNELQRINVKIEKEIDTLRKGFGQIEQNSERYSHLFDQNDQRHNQQAQSLQTLTNQLNNFNEQLTFFEEKIESYQSQQQILELINQIEEDKKLQEQEFASQVQQLSQQQNSQVKQLSNELKEFQKLIQQLESNQQSLEDKNNDLILQITQLNTPQTTNSETDAKFSQINEICNDMQETFQVLQNEIESLNQQMLTLQQNQSNDEHLSEKITEIDNKIELFDQKIQQTQNNGYYDELELKIQHLDQKLQDFEDQTTIKTDETINKVEELTMQLSTVRNEDKQTLQDIILKNQQLEKEISDLRTQQQEFSQQQELLDQEVQQAKNLHQSFAANYVQKVDLQSLREETSKISADQEKRFISQVEKTKDQILQQMEERVKNIENDKIQELIAQIQQGILQSDEILNANLDIINEKFSRIEYEIEVLKQRPVLQKSPQEKKQVQETGFEIGFLKNDDGNFIGEISEVKDESMLPLAYQKIDNEVIIEESQDNQRDHNEETNEKQKRLIDINMNLLSGRKQSEDEESSHLNDHGQSERVATDEESDTNEQEESCIEYDNQYEQQQQNLESQINQHHDETEENQTMQMNSNIIEDSNNIIDQYYIKEQNTMNLNDEQFDSQNDMYQVDDSQHYQQEQEEEEEEQQDQYDYDGSQAIETSNLENQDDEFFHEKDQNTLQSAQNKYEENPSSYVDNENYLEDSNENNLEQNQNIHDYQTHSQLMIDENNTFNDECQQQEQEDEQENLESEQLDEQEYVTPEQFSEIVAESLFEEELLKCLDEVQILKNRNFL